MYNFRCQIVRIVFQLNTQHDEIGARRLSNWRFQTSNWSSQMSNRRSQTSNGRSHMSVARSQTSTFTRNVFQTQRFLKFGVQVRAANLSLESAVAAPSPRDGSNPAPATPHPEPSAWFNVSISKLGHAQEWWDHTLQRRHATPPSRPDDIAHCIC